MPSNILEISFENKNQQSEPISLQFVVLNSKDFVNFIDS